MELNLSLGIPPAEPLTKPLIGGGGGRPSTSLMLGFCRADHERDAVDQVRRARGVEERMGSVDPTAQLNFLLNLRPSPNSPPCSDQMNFLDGWEGGGGGELVGQVTEDRSSSRFSDDEESGGARKKLRLSKEQSAFLEENFKEHSTLKPKQKAALAKQLNLRPRQVEVWFQNRRARTKLKQTEVDCEYLKRCCETLTEENRRLQKELSELKALKATHPFYAQLPATTLSMCDACGRASKSTAAGRAATASGKPGPFTALFAKIRFHAFTNPTAAPAHQHSAAS